MTKSNLNLIYNFHAVSSVRDELSRKVSRDLASIIKVDVKCISSAAPPSSCNDADSGVLDINMCHAPGQLTNRFRVPCVFKATGWGNRFLTPGEIGSALDLPPSTISALEASVLAGDFPIKNLLSLPPVKGLQFALTVCCGVGIDARITQALDPREAAHGRSVAATEAPSFESTFRQALAARHTKAVKADDAKVEVDMWNEAAIACFGIPFSDKDHGQLFNWLRQLMLTRFKRNALRSFVLYMAITHGWQTEEVIGAGSAEFVADYEAGIEALNRVGGSSFWNWDDGSSIFFWRWPKEIMQECRDGCNIFVKGRLPCYTRKQRMPPDPSDFAKVAAKIKVVRDKQYICKGSVKSLTSFFAVPKGDSDIRLVYDLSACGLNEALWAPSFWMPSVDNVLDVATHKSWFSDIDAGEMFLNYKMDQKIQPYAGVDVSWAEEGKSLRWERWSRMAMGLVSSPFATTRIFAWAMEIIKGDRFDPKNPFAWDKVVINPSGIREL